MRSKAVAESEQQREVAEKRVAELELEIEQLRANQGADEQQLQAELEASKIAADQLQQQIAELQQSVADASEESSQLRANYEQSCEKVVQLEALVSESQQRGDENRDQWAIEAEQLRAEVDRLSNDLAAATDQLSEVRVANESLNSRLSDVQQERDEARVERDARPTAEAFQNLREELEAANDQLTEIKRQYDEMLERLNHVESSDADIASRALGLTAIDDFVGAETPDDPASTFDPAPTSEAEPSYPTAVPEQDQPTNDGEATESESINFDDNAVGDNAAEDVAAEQPFAANTMADSVIAEREIPNDLIAEDVAVLGGEPEDRVESFEDDDDAWPTYQSSAESTNPSSESEPELGFGPEEPQADSVWNSPTDSEPSNANPCNTDPSKVDPSTFEDAPSEHRSDEDSVVVDQVGPWQTEPTEPAGTSAWYDESSDDGIAITNEWSAPQESDESTWGDGSDEIQFNDEAVVDEDIASDPMTVDSVWGRTEPFDAADSPIVDDETPDSESASDSTGDEPDVVNSVVSGSLADALIEDLKNEAGPESVELDDSEVCVEESGTTHEGTFVMSDDSVGSEWTSDEQPEDLQDDDDIGQSESSVNDSQWDDVNDRSHEFFETEQPIAAQEQEAEPTEATVESPDDATALMNADDGVDDDSIEAYMNRLLQRVQGDDSQCVETPMPETLSVSTSQSSLNSKPTTVAAEPEDTSVTATSPVDNDAPMVPRSQAPERAENLSAMRDLANSSAQSAISRSARVQSRDTQIQAMVSFGCAVGALACNGIAFIFLQGLLLVLAITMTFIVAFCCFREGIHLLGEAKRRVSAAESTNELDFDGDDDLVKNPSNA